MKLWKETNLNQKTIFRRASYLNSEFCFHAAWFKVLLRLSIWYCISFRNGKVGIKIITNRKWSFRCGSYNGIGRYSWHLGEGIMLGLCRIIMLIFSNEFYQINSMKGVFTLMESPIYCFDTKLRRYNLCVIEKRTFCLILASPLTLIEIRFWWKLDWVQRHTNRFGK